MSQSMQPFGKYLLLDKINTGGMAEVFRAKTFGAEGFSRFVAIKRILPQMAEDPSFLQMFIDEARIAVQLTHANIVQIYELGKHHDQLYIAMEYISGMDLRNLIHDYQQAGERLPVNAAVYIISQMCEGLDYAHAKTDNAGEPMKLVHRDISPQNILIGFDGTVKVTDFGIAKAEDRSSRTQVGMLKGKFGYMSPEQVTGKEIDHRSDLFAVGIVFYEMLTGQRLFVGDSDMATLEKVRDAAFEPPTRYNPDLPRELEDVLRKILARDPNDRYQRASELQDAVQSFLIGEGTIFTGKQLAQLIKARYADKIAAERKRMETYATLVPPPDFTGDHPSSRARSEIVVIDGAELDHGTHAGVAKGKLTAQSSESSWEVVASTGVHNNPPQHSDATRVQQAPSLDMPVPHAANANVDDANNDNAPNTASSRSLFKIAAAVLAVGILIVGGLLVRHGNAVGSLVITTAPTDIVEVYLDGHLIATRAPVTKGEIPSGEHVIVISSAGYDDKKYAVEILSGMPMVIHAVLASNIAAPVPAPALPPPTVHAPTPTTTPTPIPTSMQSTVAAPGASPALPKPKAKPAVPVNNCAGSDAFISINVVGVSGCQARIGATVIGALPLFKKPAPHGTCTIEVTCLGYKNKTVKKTLAVGQHEKVILQATDLRK